MTAPWLTRVARAPGAALALAALLAACGQTGPLTRPERPGAETGTDVTGSEGAAGADAVDESADDDEAEGAAADER